MTQDEREYKESFYVDGDNVVRYEDTYPSWDEHFVPYVASECVSLFGHSREKATDFAISIWDTLAKEEPES